MALTILASGGQLVMHGGKLLFYLPSVAAGLPGAGVLTGTAVSLRQPGDLRGHGVLDATHFARFAVTRTLTGHGALKATAKANKFTLTAAPHGHGVVSAVAIATGGFPYTLPFNLS